MNVTLSENTRSLVRLTDRTSVESCKMMEPRIASECWTAKITEIAARDQIHLTEAALRFGRTEKGSILYARKQIILTGSNE